MIAAGANWLETKGDHIVTLALIGLCLFGLGVAAFGPLWLKAIVLAWFAWP